MADPWLVYSGYPLDTKNIPRNGMTQKEYDSNHEIIHEGLGTTFDIFLDTKNILMWRWRHDNFLIIFIRNGATEIGEAHA